MNKGVSEQGGGCVDQIFTLKQIGEEAQEKKLVKSVRGFYGPEEDI